MPEPSSLEAQVTAVIAANTDLVPSECESLTAAVLSAIRGYLTGGLAAEASS